ncbi:MAG TPA: hypothetical protein VI669_04735 [Vicinamibacteria bacterium]
MPWDITQSATESNTDVPMAAGTARKLLFRVGTALTAGQTATMMIRKNGANTTLTCTITGAAGGVSTCTNTVDTVTFVDGDSFSIRYTETGSPDARVKYSFLYVAE